jgi:hypothetical protein
MTNLRRIDGSGTQPPDDDLPEFSYGITATWPNTDRALAHLVNLVFLVGIILAPAVVALVWEQVWR